MQINTCPLIKQGSLPFGLGNRLFGDDEMTIRGQALNPEQQRGLLAGMESQIDLFQEGRRDVRALDRADPFDFFSEGGRVGMKFGAGMDRRGFLKWLAGLAATIAGGASGLFKTGAKKGLGAAALLPATVAAGLVSAPLTLGLGALSFGYAQYKDYRDGKAIVDAMRAKGKISEEDADKYMSLIKQGSLPFGLGNRLFGDDEMTIRGQALNPEQQRGLLAGMESQIDLFQEGRRDVRALDRADDFDFFSEGGRVGMKFGGGMDRRGFLKWLAALGATIAGGASGIFKTGAKKGIEQVVKQAPKKFIGVEGMPAWFPRAVQKIKTHGKLIEMADKHYVNGDIYEMILPTQVPKFDMVAGKQKMSGFKTVNKKVLLEENPVSGEIEISWNVDDFDGDMKRQINFRPGESGFQKFGADVDNPGAWEFQRG